MAGVEMPPLKSSESSNSRASGPSQQLLLTTSPLKNNETQNSSSVDKHYSCHRYASKVLQNLNSLRQNTRFCDVEIAAGGKVMKAHRAVLSASSPYFQAMFTAGLLEEQKDTIELHAIAPHILHNLIDFIYTGCININQGNVQDLMVAADMLELKEVVLGCTEFLKQELHIENAIGIYRFAEGHNCVDLTNVAIDFIQCHFPQICNEEEFFDLPKDQLAKFLSSEHLRVDTEFQVFQAAMRWIMHDVTQRRRYVFEILSHVRLPLLSICLLDRAINDCGDGSLKVALRSVRKDLVTKKGSLVPLFVHPRLCAKKDIFVIGGSKRELGSAWTRSSESECTFESVERFDTFRREWCRVSPMGIGRILPGVATLNGHIFVVGGEQESQILANGECYNPREDTWSKVASMVVPRCEFGLCALYGNLYAVGGWVGEDIGGSIEMYDPSLDEWRLEGNLPEPRFSMGVVSYDDWSCHFLHDLMAGVEMPPLKSSESSNSRASGPSQQLLLTTSPLKNNETQNSSSVDKHYSCHRYASKVLQNLNSLRQNTRFCDVEIAAGGKVMKAHRAVLSASSPYFQAMFTAGLLEEQKDTIELHAIAPHILHNLIDFIYTGCININQGNVQDLMVAADMLELKEVVLGCTEFLKQELHIENAIGIYRFAEGHNCVDLTNVAIDFIQCHFPQICNEEEFFDLPKDQLAKFLSSEHLRVDTEFQVFQAAMRWIMHDVTQRRRYVFEILSHVRLPLLSICLLDRAINDCGDGSLKVALRSVRKDLVTKKGSLVPLFVHPRLCAKKDIFVIGGSKRELGSAWTRSSESECTFESVERFDTFRREWCRVSPMGIGRILPGVATLNGHIFVVGGEQESQILANGECYNPREDTWSKVASMVVPRCEFGLCALYGNLYAVGGWVGEDIGGSIEMYDPSLDEWRLEGNLPEPRFSMGVVSYDGLIYIVGGCTHSRRHLQDLLSFNPMTGEWTPLPSMRVPRSQMGVAVLDGFLYVVGGTSRHHEVLKNVERYSFEENRWEEIAPLSIGRASPAVASADGLLYVIGGDQNHEVNFYRAQITITSVECYDPLADEWYECPPLPESRSEAGAVVV